MSVLATFAELARETYSAGGMDLHLVPDQTPRIRFGDGRLGELEAAPLSAAELDLLAREHVGAAGVERLDQTGCVQRQVSFELVGGTPFLGRTTLTKSGGRVSVSFRLLVKGGPPTLELLRVPEAVTSLLEAPTGLIVVSGPHNSGKTSTLHALLDWINTHRSAHLCTVEDPLDRVIEPKRCLLQQREVGIDVPDVPAGINAAREQGADVIAVAALGSLEALTASLHAAETGHLVLVQVHANTAEEALERIVEATPETMHALVRRSLSQTLLGVTCQRLLPREPRGRVAAHQLLLADDGLRASIASGGSLAGYGAPGSVKLRDQVAALREEGLISADTAAAALEDA